MEEHTLSSREEVLRMFKSNGYNAKAIADEYNLFYFVVWNYLSYFYDKDPEMKQYFDWYYNYYRTDSSDIIFIGDTHLGRKDKDIDFVKAVYDYAGEEGVKTIVHLGDLIDGNCNPNRAPEHPIPEQLDFVARNYPYTEQIKTFLLLGNHDFNTFEKDPYYVRHRLLQDRRDIEILGEIKSFLLVARDKRLYLRHSDRWGVYVPPMESKLTMNGHSHYYKHKQEEYSMTVPPLSDILKLSSYSGFMRINFLEDHCVSNVYAVDPYANYKISRLMGEQEKDKVMVYRPINHT